MATTKYLRLDLAARQLETAVWLYLNGKDRFSVITLAGAASGILTQLVLNANKQPFVDFARLLMNELSGSTPPRKRFNRHINVQFGIDVLKHHAATDPPTVELDVEHSAERAVTKALVDYVELRGQKERFVIAFFNWMWVSRDGPNIMEKYAAESDRIKRLRK